MEIKAYALYELPLAQPTAAASQAQDCSASALIDMLLKWRERSRQRRLLLTLEDHILRDIGVSRTDAELEANKPCWRD